MGPFSLYGWGTRITSGILPFRPAGRCRCASPFRIVPDDAVEPGHGSHPWNLIIKKAPLWDLFHYMAGGQGFEPWLAESESAVLPLDDPPLEKCRKMSADNANKKY